MSLPKLPSSSLALRIPLSTLASLSSSSSASAASASVPPYYFLHLQNRIHQLYTHIDSSRTTLSHPTLPSSSSVFPSPPSSLRELLATVYRELQPIVPTTLGLSASASASSSPSLSSSFPPSLYTAYVSSIYPLLSTLNQSIITYIDTFREPIQNYALHYSSPLNHYLNRIFVRSMTISTLNNALYDAISVRTTNTMDTGNLQRGFVRSFSVLDLVHQSTADISAFCVEKYGAVPQVRIHCTNSASSSSSSSSSSSTRDTFTIIGIPSFIQYAYVELLKNAMRTMLDRYTTLHIDDAPPIDIHLSIYNQQLLIIRIEDTGNGIILPTELIKHIPNAYCIHNTSSSAGSGGTPTVSRTTSTITNRKFDSSIIVGSFTHFPYYSSTAFTREENNYQYSREFGVSFTGQGLGLIRSQLYSYLHNGSLELFSVPNKGTTAIFCIDITGSCTDTQVLERVEKQRRFNDDK